MNARFNIVATVILLVALFLGINMFSMNALRGVKIDSSEGKIHTLSVGSKNIAASLEERITLKFYYSKKLAQGIPALSTYGNRVRETLEEFTNASKGKIALEIVEPLAFSEAEDAAVEAGLQGAPLDGVNGNFFLGLVVEGPTDTRVTIPFFSPTKENFLEYDIAKAIHSVGTPDKPIVGLISGIQMQGGFTMDPRTRQPAQTPPWVIAGEVESVATINNLGTAISEIPQDVDVLWVAHPKGLTDETLYAIDQFVMRGGHAVFQVDPFNETDAAQAQMNPAAEKSSSLNRLLNAWGVDVPEDRIVADQDLALQVNTQRNGGRMPYVVWLRVTDEQTERNDPVAAQMKMLHFISSGHITKKEVASTQPAGDAQGPAPKVDVPVAAIEPLVRTGANASTVSSMLLQGQPNPQALLSSFSAGSEALTLAARLTGKVKSAFPEGKPGQDPAAPSASLTESAESINVIVIADADMLSDMYWTQTDRFFGQVMKIADNGDLICNAIDNLAGNEDLISLRARDTSFRPFTRVEEMRKSAAKTLLEQQEAVDAQIRNTQEELGKLQAARGENSDSLVLTAEQRAAIKELEGKLADARKEQRKLKLELNKDIEALSAKLKMLNIGLMPAVVTLFAVSLAIGRRARRSAASK